MSTVKRVRAERRRGMSPPPLLGALLRLVWQQVRRQMAADIAASGFDDLQDAHLSVFQYPGPEGLRPVDLARQLRMSRQATNYLIAQLEEFGYLERRAEEGDRRRIFLTTRGRRLMASIQTSVRQFEARAARQAGRTRFTIFMDVLRTMAGEQWTGK